jgi:hypothetical protein
MFFIFIFLFSRFAMSTANFLHIKKADEAMHTTGEVVKFSPPLDFKGALYLGTRGSALVSGENYCHLKLKPICRSCCKTKRLRV